MVITLETAKLAKEKGFKKKAKKSYRQPVVTKRGTNIKEEREYKLCKTGYEYSSFTEISYPNEEYSAPTQEQLQKWIREKHGMHLVIIPTVTADWTYKVITVLSERDNGITSVSDLPPYKEVCGEDFSTYEDAFEAGLKEELKQIKL